MAAKHKKTEAKPRKSGTAKDVPPPERSEQWDEVAEASWESFPASDPPPWTVSRPGKPDDEKAKDAK